MTRQTVLLVREVCSPSYPDATSSVKRTEVAQVIIEWPDESLLNNEYGIGDWRVVPRPTMDHPRAATPPEVPRG